jgi:heme A synthase
LSQLGFRRFAWSVLAYNVAASAWGAFVRATGSGAGCGEHWPDCNGQVVPRAPALETIIEFMHRVTAGLATILVVALCVWAWRAFPKGHPARAGAAASVGFIVSEALIGAGLVLLHLVKDDASPMRAVAMGLHLVNTFFLLASLTVTAAYASDARARVSVRGNEGSAWAAGVALALLVGAGVTGAVAALGDTLFPAASLAAGLREDALATAHVFVRLRGLHPVIAGTAAVGALAAATLVGAARGESVGREVRAVRVLVVAQVLAGVTNLLLMAPVWMQLVHLVLADGVWIAVVALGARGIAERGVEQAAAAVATTVAAE